MDLSRNERLYRGTGYRVQLPADRGVFILPTEEDRGTRVEDAAAPHTVNYFSDGRWARSPVQMIDAVLRDEVAASGIFVEVLERAQPDACLIRARLQKFDVGTESHVTGWRSFAGLALNLEVWGPESESGKRLLLLNEPFVDAQTSEVDWHPAPASSLMGACLRGAMHRLLSALDQANVGRSSVPLDLGQ